MAALCSEGPTLGWTAEIDRFSQVYVGADERLFLADFWSQGVCMGHGRSPCLLETARAIHAWAHGSDLGQMRQSVAFFAPNADAEAFEQGREVEHTWRCYLADPTLLHLRPFLEVAGRNPILRGLFLFTSLNRLCFSRCTGFPYTEDCPMVIADGRGKFIVVKGWHQDDVELGRGKPREALEIVLRNLPPDCGPARKGTAELPPL